MKSNKSGIACHSGIDAEHTTIQILFDEEDTIELFILPLSNTYGIMRQLEEYMKEHLPEVTLVDCQHFNAVKLLREGQSSAQAL